MTSNVEEGLALLRSAAAGKPDDFTIRQRLVESGKRGAELLLHVLAQPPAVPIQESILPELVVRQTTAPPPKG